MRTAQEPRASEATATRPPRAHAHSPPFLGLILTVLPLPSWLAVIRPAFLVLTVLYWSITRRAPAASPRFFGGLALDVFQGTGARRSTRWPWPW